MSKCFIHESNSVVRFSVSMAVIGSHGHSKSHDCEYTVSHSLIIMKIILSNLNLHTILLFCLCFDNEINLQIN